VQWKPVWITTFTVDSSMPPATLRRTQVLSIQHFEQSIWEVMEVSENELEEEW